MRLTHVMVAAAAFALPAGAGAQQAAPAQPATPPAAQVPDQPTQPADQTPAPAQAAPETTPTAATPPAAPAPANAATAAATQADLKAGAPVFDQTGASVGKIESANAQGAVIATGKVRVRIPIASFGKNDHGLIVAMTKTQLEAAATKTGRS